MVNHQEVARGAAEAGVMRMTGALAVLLPSVELIQVLVNPDDYRQPVAVIAVWLMVLGAAGWLLPRLRAGGLSAGEAVAAILIAVAAVGTSGAMSHPRGANAGFDMAILGTVWLLALVVMSCPCRLWVPGALLVFAVHGVLLIRDLGLTSRSLSQLEAGGYVLTAVLIAFATLRPALAMHASVAVRRASLASRLAAEGAAAAAIQQERQDRLTVLEKGALPLLRGIADGTLDPIADEVRDQCARQATLLRHSLTGHSPGADGSLVAGLEPALRPARARGLLVTVQVIGDPGMPPPPVARSVLAAVDAVLSALPPDQVTLTVLGGGDDDELYLSFGASLPSGPDLTRFGLHLPAAARWDARVSGAETGQGCLELSWRKHDAA